MFGNRKAVLVVFICWALSLFATAIPTNSSRDSSDNTTRIERRYIIARKPPPPTRPHIHGPKNGTTPEPVRHLSCGLEVPTPQSWKKYQKKIAAWFETQWNLYLLNEEWNSLPQYLLNEFAPEAAPSSEFCDTFGACSIGSCLHLKKDLSQHDKQMAYFVFEQISGLDHMFASISEGTRSAADFTLERSNELVKRYSSATLTEHKIKERRKLEKLLISIGSGIGLLATGGMAFGLDKGAAEVFKNIIGFQVSSYISIVGVLNAVRGDMPSIVSDLETNFRASFNELRRQSERSILEEMRTFMTGDTNNKGQNMLSIMQGEAFFAPDPDLQIRIQTQAERVMYAAAVNALWPFDRAYIIDTNAPYGGCKSDRRGPKQNRVCLSEFPYRTFWLYAINPSEENDHGHDDQAQVHGPFGYRDFFEESTATFNITLEDVVRSSFFAHENNLEDAIDEFDFKQIGSKLSPKANLGKVPGVFTVPICRNPGGESISSVWAKKGRNYPCMCGEFGWNNGLWSLEKEETLKFLRLTGLMYSEDWEDYCSNHNHCKGQNDIDWHRELNSMRKEGDPLIPKSLKHPFRKCKKSRKHRIGYPENDYNRDRRT